jgi:hypothetical protein
MKSIYQSINELYDKAGYLARYGGDLYITIFVFLLVFLIVSYYSVMSKIKPLRANWTNERCKPNVVPFAGLIYRPEGKGVFEATADNFAECGQTITKNLAGYALQPFQYLLLVITNVFKQISNSINATRAVFNKVRTGMADVGSNVMGRSLNILSPIQQMMIALKSGMEKAQGVGATVIFTLYGAFLALKAMIVSIIDFVILVLIALVVIIIILWIFPWTWPFAIASTIGFIIMAAMCVYVIVVYSQAMHGSVNRDVPEEP